VSEWEVVAPTVLRRKGKYTPEQESDFKKRERERLRNMMSDSIRQLAETGREILYKVDENRRWGSINVELAAVTQEASDRPDYLKLFHPRDALNFVHRSLRRGGARIEAALEIKIDPDENSVYINYFNRNEAFASVPVVAFAPNSKVAKVTLCFALAMVGEICMSLPKMNNPTLSLYADDRGSGKLLRYYEKEYGLKRNVGRVDMTGTLKEALEKCSHVWETTREGLS
jgi:hypothetical protein